MKVLKIQFVGARSGEILVRLLFLDQMGERERFHHTLACPEKERDVSREHNHREVRYGPEKVIREINY